AADVDDGVEVGGPPAGGDDGLARRRRSPLEDLLGGEVAAGSAVRCAQARCTAGGSDEAATLCRDDCGGAGGAPTVDAAQAVGSADPRVEAVALLAGHVDLLVAALGCGAFVPAEAGALVVGPTAFTAIVVVVEEARGELVAAPAHEEGLLAEDRAVRKGIAGAGVGPTEEDLSRRVVRAHRAAIDAGLCGLIARATAATDAAIVEAGIV